MSWARAVAAVVVAWVAVALCVWALWTYEEEVPEPQITEVCRGEDLVYVLVSEDSNDPIAMTAIPSAPQCRGESEQP